MIETAIAIAFVALVAIIAFVLIDRAEQPAPIPFVLKLIVLIIALLAIASSLGYEV